MLEGEADAVALHHRADLEIAHRQAGHAEVARFVEPARQQPARIVVGVLEIERPGEVDLAVDRLEIGVRLVGAAIDHVGQPIERLVEALAVDGGERAAEDELHLALQPFGKPRHQREGLLAADQAEIAHHPWSAAVHRRTQLCACAPHIAAVIARLGQNL